MKLPIELLLLSFASLASSASLQPRNANFAAVLGLTSLSTDHSTPDDDALSDKFFHEATFDGHYDGRFAEAKLPDDTRAFHLQLLLKSYVDTMDRIGIRTWIMHGCLLGWWWNGKIMPWDNDLDFMLDERSTRELGNWWNMTVHHYTAKDFGFLDPIVEEEEKAVQVEPLQHTTTAAKAKDEGIAIRKQFLREEVAKKGKKYLLEVNPNYINTSTNDRHNVIDARWIDTATGLYIDITTLHTSPP
ncbi:mannosyltransferase [Neocucurbitaria cava]|uniref:Mannosyltransferase n=1 Tax=Neocucurbitaria cava TaxID=798079 RepID=A0A9W8Y297_9PLEO|nr:mannosyltransferase [Neocucurbitaria cava]